jgi:hypothetical protein
VSKLHYYFAFGSNLSSGRLRERAPTARAIGAARLAGYRLVWDKEGSDGSGKVNLAPDARESVWGVVFALSPADLAALDGFEPGYARIEAPVALRDGATLAAHLYCSDQRSDGLSLHAWYKALIVDGAQEHALPAEWIAFLEALPVL